jgi:hypothetical protein
MNHIIHCVLFFILYLSSLARAEAFKFEWESVEGAKGYFVEIKKSLNSPKIDTFETQGALWEGDLPFGRHQVRIQAFDKRRVGSEWSDWFSIEVLAPPPSILLTKEVVRKTIDQEVVASWTGEGNDWTVSIQKEQGEQAITKKTKEKIFLLTGFSPGRYRLTVSSELSKGPSTAEILIRDEFFQEFEHLTTHRFSLGLGRTSYQFDNAKYLSRTQFEAGGRFLSYQYNAGTGFFLPDFKLKSFEFSTFDSKMHVSSVSIGTQILYQQHRFSMGIGGYITPKYTYDQLIESKDLNDQVGMALFGGYRFDFDSGIPMFWHFDFWDATSRRNGYKIGEFELGGGVKVHWMEHKGEVSLDITNLVLTSKEYREKASKGVEDHLNIRTFQLRFSYILERLRIEIR